MNKLISRLMLLCLIGCTLPLNAMQETPEPKERESKYIPNYVPRGLLIFLDSSEDRVAAAITLQLLEAIKHKPCPIIASSSVLGNLFRGYKKVEEYRKKSTSELKDILSKNPIQVSEWTAGEYLTVGLLAAGFDPQQWIIKKIEREGIERDEIEWHNYYLLIPHSYLDTIGIKINAKTAVLFDQQTTSNPQKISPLELQLGLKINHMTDCNIDDFSRIHGIGQSSLDKYFMSTLPKIFCTRSDYLNAQEKTRAYWSIYLSGHGQTKKAIAFMKPDDFKSLLDFFAYKIHTKALMYNSCYAGGTNAQEVYSDTKSLLQKTYPFALINLALTDAPVTIDATLFGATIKSGKLELTTSINFSDLMQKMMQDPADYEAATKAIATQGRVSSPQIRLPGTEWFSVIESKQAVASIGEILAKTRSPEHMLDVTSFFKTNASDLKALLLYAANIPFTLKINADWNFAIISMIPGPALHKLKAIDSQDDINKVLGWFMSIDRLDAYKIFYIEKIGDSKDVIIRYDTGRWGDEFKCIAFFSRGGECFIKRTKFQPGEKCTEEQKAEYLSLLARIQGNFDQIKVCTAKWEGYNFRSDIPNFENSTIIERIEAQEIYLNRLLPTLYERIKIPNGFVWCKELVAQYLEYPPYIVPGATKDTTITLTDVIVDNSKKEGDLYYTYNGKFYYAGNPIDHDYREDYKKPRALVPGQLSSAILPSQATPEDIKKIGEIYKKQAEKFPKIEKKPQDKKQKIEPLPKAEKPADMEKFEVEDYKGNTPLHNAAEAGRLDVVRYLIEEKGSAINEPNKQYKQTPLYLAAKAGALDVVRYLIENKAPVDDLNPIMRETPLHVAAEGNHLNVVKYLVRDAGANVNLRNRFGDRPIDLAKDPQIKNILAPKN